MSGSQRPDVAFALSLVGGILILIGGGMVMMWAVAGTPVWDGPMGNMMGSYSGIMSGTGFSGTSFFTGMAVFGLITGALVLIGAVMLYGRPQQASTWGIMILVFSALSLFGMGGFFIGAIIGLVGGILALSWKPVQAVAPSPAQSS